MRRVVVTGIGVLSSIGNTVTRFEESLRAGRSGVGPITQVDTSRLRFHNAAEIQGFEPAEHFSELTLARSLRPTWYRRRARRYRRFRSQVE
jgi:3-oxoacyl-[acyl-carrier-protein] synthase II